eukprot:COSAG01_NODE_14319_length_1469_cov_1.337226_1_plen_50_part_10
MVDLQILSFAHFVLDHDVAQEEMKAQQEQELELELGLEPAMELAPGMEAV